MSESLFFYKLISPYHDEQGKPVDITKNCKLSINEIDSNFLTLKDYDIKTAEFIREEKVLILTRNDGDKLIVPLENVTYDLNVVTGSNASGASITISYDGADGEKSVTLSNLLTYDNLKDVIGSDILTKVITNNTLKGNGTMQSPLRLSGVEKTGTYAPVIGVIDTTNGEKLPNVAKLGTRYITKEWVNDYGYLYNGDGVNQISEKLEADERGWRVPSKADWDALLNSVEPCEYRNHGSSKCHVELGKVAGSELKSECGWLGQEPCNCAITKPFNCSYDLVDSDGDEFTSSTEPQEHDCPIGVDKYGMTVLPSGFATKDAYDRPQADKFGEETYFWTTSHIYGDLDQDIYVKKFKFNKCGVEQIGECPNPYFSVRLVKDFDGSNYFGSVDFDGVTYNTILFPESRQIWLASNYCGKENIDEANFTEVNNGEVLEKRTEFFINEWNGKYWERKRMNEADTIIIKNPTFDQTSGKTITVCWHDSEDIEHCMDVYVPKLDQNNVEYGVFTDDESCNKILVNTDDLITDRVFHVILPILAQEIEDRKEADSILQSEIDELSASTESAMTELWEAINDEVSARTEADMALSGAIETESEERKLADEALSGAIDDLSASTESAITELWEALSAETEDRIEGDLILDEKINNEIERAISAETTLDDKIESEIDRATTREDEIDGKLIDSSKVFELNVAVNSDESNLVLETNDGNPDHFINIKFNGNFGEI